eukprot:351182-Amorphochlora_amoeboformis.AAC.1
MASSALRPLSRALSGRRSPVPTAIFLVAMFSVVYLGVPEKRKMVTENQAPTARPPGPVVPAGEGVKGEPSIPAPQARGPPMGRAFGNAVHNFSESRLHEMVRGFGIFFVGFESFFPRPFFELSNSVRPQTYSNKVLVFNDYLSEWGLGGGFPRVLNEWNGAQKHICMYINRLTVCEVRKMTRR